MSATAIAAASASAVRAARRVVEVGGGAVDAAIAAMAVATVNEPGVLAPGGGAYVTIGSSSGTVDVIDGYMAAPGIGRDSESPPALRSVSMAYGGGMTTLVGPGSIATPGMWAAMEEAHRSSGRVDWQTLIQPAADLARNGFPLGRAAQIYLVHARDAVFGHDEGSRRALHHPDGRPIEEGQMVRMPDLATTLEEIGRVGSSAIHGGTLGRRMADDLGRRGSLLTSQDLAGYRAIRREPSEIGLDGWRLYSNPTPAVGGDALLGVLERLRDTTPPDHARAQRQVFEARRLGEALRAPSTVHISTVDATGLACAITASAGYGSGVMPAGTGFWMNNALGELELVPDLAELSPGARLTSNMAPTVGIGRDGAVLSIGSPGADRITSALSQVIWSLLVEGRTEQDAVTASRVHVALADGVVWTEPGAVGESWDAPEGLEWRRFDDLHMYFGGVGIAALHGDGRLVAAADPRRAGASAVLGG